MALRQFNKYQTPLTEEMLKELPKEVSDELFELINTVPYIERLISPNRKYAKDLDKDENGRIIVDLLNPHILEDMDYFRPSALHFKQHGVYTKLRPNSSPNSEYGKWLKEEVRRSWYGYVRESDGEWIPGDMYFYLNYCPIVQTKIKKGTKKADRVVDFPEVWEGIYLRFHYMHQASHGGLYNDFTGGQHGAEIAKRGCSKSYTMASILAKIFILGENSESCKNVRGVVTAYQKEYLTKDGTLNKFIEMIDFCAEHTQFPSKRLKSSMQEMTWKMGYIDTDKGINKGTLNEVIGVSSKDDSDKLRGKRPHPLSSKVLTVNGIMNWGDIKLGDFVYNDKGIPVKVVDIIDYDEDDIYRITMKDGRVTFAQKDHLFPVYYRSSGKIKQRLMTVDNMINNTLYINKRGTSTYKWALPKNDCVMFPEQPIPIDPYVLGLYLGDGDYNHSWDTHINLTMSRDDLDSVQTYIPYKINKSKYREITHHILVPSARTIMKNLGLENKISATKFIPKEYLFNSENNRIQLLNGLLDSDGTCSSDYGVIEYSSKSEELSNNVVWLCRSLGFNCKKTFKRTNGVVYYRVYIYSNDKRLFNLDRKKQKLNSKCLAYSQRCPIKDVSFSHREKCRCITVDSEDGLYLIDEFIVTHNSSKIFIEEFGNFRNISDIHRVLLPSVQEGNIAFGQLMYCGTGGSEDADFSGALEMMYNPAGFNLYALPNVYDKNSQGKSSCIYFFPAYLNRKPHQNEDGVSDVIAALVELLMDRYKVKYNTSDPIALTRTKAENPCTIQEAVMKRDGNMYPVADLTDVDNNLTVNPSILDSVFTCTFEMDKSGEIVPKPEYDSKPIRSFPHQDNKLQGCCEIFKHPEIDKQTGKPFSYRYIAGNDTYDDDSSTTVSLGSMFILDLWTDKIVFEYTGRPPFAADFYETCRRALLFYNARMNYEAHPYSQIVRLPNGTTKLWGDIKIGDELFGPNSNTVTVVDIPMDGEDDIYNITFVDGRTVRASSGHIWNVYTLNTRNKTREITTKEMFEYGVINKFNKTKFYIPKHEAVEYPSNPVDIDPYTLGMLIAEGSLTKFKKDKHQKNKRNTVQISSCKEDALYYKDYIPYDMKYIGTKGCSYHLYIEDIDIKLSKLGLLHTNSHTKFIPLEYLNNDSNTRLELLKGLMDGDGHANPKGGSIYVTVSKQLADDIMLLLRSLGIYCKLEKSDNSFRVRISSTIPIFKLPRKVKNQYIYSPDKIGSKAKGFLNKVGIKSIEYIGIDKCKCVTVDSKDGLYLIGDYITTHNCNKKGLFAHFSRYNSLYLLTDTLEFLKDKDLIRGETISNKSKGTTATDPVKKYGRMLIRNWLMQPKTRVEMVDGQEVEVTYPALQDLKQKALIKELCLYNTDGNFDRHDALVMLMLLREDRLRLCGNNTAEAAANKVDKNYLGQDDFFTKNYKAKSTLSTNMGM